MSQTINHNRTNLKLPEGNGNTPLIFTDEAGKVVQEIYPIGYKKPKEHQTVNLGAAIGKIAKAGKPK